MLIRLLLGMVFSVLFCSAAMAEDFWDTVFDEMYKVDRSSHNEQGAATDADRLFPMYSLSLQTHGAYFGSGNEFLLGGGQVSGLGGVRHNEDHSSNHPTYGVYPEVQHLFESEAGYMGMMWGVPDDFAPVYSELADDQAADGDHASDKKHQGNTGIINDDDWWDD